VHTILMKRETSQQKRDSFNHAHINPSFQCSFDQSIPFVWIEAYTHNHIKLKGSQTTIVILKNKSNENKLIVSHIKWVQK
jgi:hypothetical protein